MIIKPSLKRTLNAANQKIIRSSRRTDRCVPYFRTEIIDSSFRTYRNIFHKIIIKIALCFCREENVFNVKEKQEFLRQLDASVDRLKSNQNNAIILNKSYNSNAEKSDVIVMFKDFFKGYESRSVCVKDGYLHVFFCKTGCLDEDPEFYVSVFMEFEKVEEVLEETSTSLSISYDEVSLFDEVSLIKTNEMSFFNNTSIVEKLEISDNNILKLTKNIDEYSFLKNDRVTKSIYILNIINMMMLSGSELKQKRHEIIDAIGLLRHLQSNILSIPLELNFSYYIMMRYGLNPHASVSLIEYFALMCRDDEVLKYLRVCDERKLLR